jgi:hypothetical protein
MGLGHISPRNRKRAENRFVPVHAYEIRCHGNFGFDARNVIGTQQLARLLCSVLA